MFLLPGRRLSFRINFQPARPRKCGLSDSGDGSSKAYPRCLFGSCPRATGFYEAGRDLLVMPGFVPSDTPPPDANENNGGGGSGGGGGGSGDGETLHLDPLLLALLKKIPETEKGWPAAQRVRWFKTFAMNVSQIYDSDEDPVEMKIEQDKAAN